MVNLKKSSIIERIEKAKQEDDEDEPLNFFLIVIDSMSRADFLRKFPLTVKLFENMNQRQDKNSFSLYQFMRHHIVGYSTG